MANSLPPNVHVSSHPCVRAKLSQLRSASANTRDTKRLVHEIATIVGCEALAHGLLVETTGPVSQEKNVFRPFDQHPINKGRRAQSVLGYQYDAEKIMPANISLVPILRSGLSMVDAVQALLPDPISVHHLGMYREKTTLQPVEYYNNLPYHKSGEQSSVADMAIIVDPIIATGSTVCAAIETLKDWGVTRIISIAILASRSGLERAAESWPEGVELWVGGVDAETDERGMIKPGLGDIGDRLFLTLGK